MKVGRGLPGLMSKSHREYTSRGRPRSLYTAALIALGFSLALTGCGELSLNQLLENQEPGELDISPKAATVDTDSSIEIAGKGGFKPYTFSATAGSFEETDGATYYKAPSAANPAVTITVADGLSSEATAIFEVVSSTGLNFPEAMTIAIGENTGYVEVKDGTEPYNFWLEGDGRIEVHVVLKDRVKYYADVPSPTTAYVWVEDSALPPNQATLKVTVVEAIDE
jgi:hypothetical protein